MRRITFLLLVTILFSLGFSFFKAGEAKEGYPQHVVMVLVPGLAMGDFYELMEDEDLWENASVVALNRTTNGRTTPLSETLTLSSGTPAVDMEGGRSVIPIQRGKLNETEKTYELSSFRSLKEKNINATHQAVIGSLGTTMQESGVHTSFIGHSNIKKETHQFAPFFTIDKRGVTAGNRDAGVREDKEAAGGYVMDKEKSLESVRQIQRLYPKTWTVVEWGDFFRSVELPEEDHAKRVKGLTAFLKNLNQESQNVYLLGIAPPESSLRKGQQMVPFAKWEQARREENVQAWWSPTVDQRFLGSNIDAAPTILKTFGIHAPEQWNGNALTNRSEESVTVEEMKEETKGAAHIYKTRSSVLSTYITLLIIILIAGYVFWKKGRTKKSRSLLKWVVLTGMASPLSFLAASSVFGRDITNIPLYCGMLIFFSVFIGMLMTCFGRKEAVWIVSFLLLLVLSLDIMQGSFLMKQSYLGYDPLIGARYGGIGNELGGFYAAASILFMEPLLRKKYLSRWAVWVAAFVFLTILGASSLGKNAGVTLASGLMFFTLAVSFYKKKLSIREILVLSIGIFAGLIGVLWILQQFGESSHIGRAFQLGVNGEWGELRSIAVRKLQMNIKIVMHSNWTKLLLTSYLLAAVYLIFERSDFLADSQKIVLKAGAFGSLFLLLLNDSGAVAASTSMFFLLCARIVWLFEETSYKKYEKDGFVTRFGHKQNNEETQL